ncbi:MAG: hypothetical protein C4335_14870 [Armatimonadota bacterium]
MEWPFDTNCDTEDNINDTNSGVGGNCGDKTRWYNVAGTRRHTDGMNVIFADGHAKWTHFRRFLNDPEMWGEDVPARAYPNPAPECAYTQ